jgi:hypothetical protein
LTDIDLDDPWAGYAGGDPGETAFGGDVPASQPWQRGGITTAMDFDTPNHTVTQYNLGIQQQLGTDWMVSATYMGNLTRHMWGTQHINQVIFVPGVGDANGNCFLNGATVNFTVRAGSECSSRKTSNRADRRRFSIFPDVPGSVSELFGPTGRIDSGGNASYNGLILGVQRRPATGVTLNMNYTWSRCITDPYQYVVNGGNADNGWTKSEDRSFDRGDCTTSATDRRHTFNMSGVAESPEFSNRALQVIAGDWSLSPILRINSGAALTVHRGTRDDARVFMRDQRPNVLMDNVYGDGTAANFLNPAAFGTPTTGTHGDLGVGAVRGPGTWQFDVALSRGFATSETTRIEIRAEAFNLTNSTRFNNPETRHDRGNTFGQIRSARDPRLMQFALKFVF